MKPLVLALLLAGTGCGAPGVEATQAASAAGGTTKAERASIPGSPEDPTPQASQAQTVVQASSGTTTLAVGQVLEIALEGNAATGYAWELEADGAPQLRPEPAPPAPQAVQPDGPRLVGGPATQRWHFRAAQAGETTVRLVYRRPWEQEAPVREAVFGVVVNGATVP